MCMYLVRTLNNSQRTVIRVNINCPLTDHFRMFRLRIVRKRYLIHSGRRWLTNNEFELISYLRVGKYNIIFIQGT